MSLPQAIDIRISMLRLAPQCFAFTSYWGEPERAPHVRVVQRARLYIYIYLSSDLGHGCKIDKMAALCVAVACDSNTRRR